MKELTIRELKIIEGGTFATGSLQAGKVFAHAVTDFVNGFIDRFTLFTK